LSRYDSRENLMVSGLEILATIDRCAHFLGFFRIPTGFVDADFVSTQALEQVDLGVLLGLNDLELLDSVTDQAVSAPQDRILAF
jgi:hypothetical protein